MTYQTNIDLRLLETRDSATLDTERMSNQGKVKVSKRKPYGDLYVFAYENEYSQGFYYGDLVEDGNIPPCFPDDVECSRHSKE